MSRNKTLTILVTKGPYVSEAPEMAMKTALQARRKGYNVNIFLYLDGVWVSHITEEKPFTNPSEWMRSAIKRGINVASCQRCSEARELVEGSIVDGVRIDGSMYFMDLVKGSDALLTFGG